MKRRRQVLPAAVRRDVINTWGNDCWLNLPGCTRIGAEDDHIIPFKAGGKGTVANIRRACKHCNVARSNRVLSGYGATIHAVIGPPTAGKTTFVADHAAPDALVLDWDRLADALTLDGMTAHHAATPTAMAATGAWKGAYDKLVRMNSPVEVWIIKSIPATHAHPRMLDEWLALDYTVHVVDPGAATVFARLDEQHRNEGARMTARQWYGLHLSAELVAARQHARRDELARYGLRSAGIDESRDSFARPAW